MQPRFASASWVSSFPPTTVFVTLRSLPWRTRRSACPAASTRAFPSGRRTRRGARRAQRSRESGRSFDPRPELVEDARVERDEVALRPALLGPEDLVGVGDGTGNGREEKISWKAEAAESAPFCDGREGLERLAASRRRRPRSKRSPFPLSLPLFLPLPPVSSARPRDCLLRRWSFFGSVSSLSTSATGSPVEAFSTSPPSSIAIWVSSRFETTERGRVSAMSSSDAKSSRCLMRSHAGFVDAAPALRAHDHPRALQLLAVERELQVALREGRVHVRALRRPRAAVPHHDGAAAVLSAGDDSLERRVFEGMVLDVRRHPFDGGVEDGPFGTAHDRRTPFHSRRKS